MRCWCWGAGVLGRGRGVLNKMEAGVGVLCCGEAGAEAGQTSKEPSSFAPEPRKV